MGKDAKSRIEQTIYSIEREFRGITCGNSPIYVELHRSGMKEDQSVILIYDDFSGRGLEAKEDYTHPVVDFKLEQKEPCRERWNMSPEFVREYVEAGVEKLRSEGYNIKLFYMVDPNDHENHDPSHP